MTKKKIALVVLGIILVLALCCGLFASRFHVGSRADRPGVICTVVSRQWPVETKVCLPDPNYDK